MWRWRSLPSLRPLIQLRALVRPRFVPLPAVHAGQEAAALRELDGLRDLYVSGALPLKDYEWHARRLARSARSARSTPDGTGGVRLRRAPSPLARARRALFVPLALATLAVPLVWEHVAGGGATWSDVGRSIAGVQPVEPTVTPFPRLVPGTDGVIAVDYFDDPRTGLLPNTSSDPARYGRGYMDGGYAVRIVDPNWHFVAGARPVGTYGDVGVTVDATMLGDVADRYVVVSCRDGERLPSLGYRLSVQPGRGLYSLVRWDGDRTVTLQSPQPSPAIRRGHGVNRIGLSCVGGEITATVNGSPLKTVSDATYTSGSVWFGVGAYTNRNVTSDARFHNLVISDH